MRKTIRYTPLLAVVLLAACAKMMSTSPQDPYFPATASILPLAKNNSWTYSYTAWDSLGKMILPHRLDWHINIKEQFGMADDTTLVQLNGSRAEFPYYAYEYERENEGKGYLVVYRSRYPLAIRGLYIIGEYQGSTISLYPQEQLWLAYPGDSGKVWQFKSDPLGDTSSVTEMELVSTNASSYRIDTASMTGISSFDSCYCYKQTSGDSISYYYYNKDIGAIAYQRYIAGRLRDTYILKSASVDTTD